MKDGEGDKTRQDELWDPTWSDSQPPYDWTLTKDEKDALSPVGGHEEAEEETNKETDCEVDDENDGQDERREDFLRRVEEDPDLPISRDLARKAYDFMMAKIDELGLQLLMPPDLHAGSRTDSAAEDLHGEKTEEEEQEPKITEENEGLEKDFKQEEEDQQFKNSVEEIHEDWDSSEASTKNKWSDQSDSPSLEQKLKNCPKEDHYRVALMHEINHEKKDRRDT